MKQIHAKRRNRSSVELMEGRQLFSAIASYEAASTSANAASLPSTTVSGVNATPITRAAAGTHPFIPATWETNTGYFAATPDGPYQTTAAGSVAYGHYFTFTVAPAAGKTLSISDIQLAPFEQANDPQWVPGNWAIRYRVDNDADASNGNGGSWSQSSTYTAPPVFNSPPLTTVSLSGVTLAQGAGVELQVVIWNGLSYAASYLGRLSGPDVVVDGSVADAPAAPSGLAVHGALGSLGNIVTWTNNASVTSVTIERSTSSTFTTNVLDQGIVGSNNTYTDTSIVPNTRYYYRVRIGNAQGLSPWSASDNIDSFHIYDVYRQNEGTASSAPRPGSGVGDRHVYQLDGSSINDPQHYDIGAFLDGTDVSDIEHLTVANLDLAKIDAFAHMVDCAAAAEPNVTILATSDVELGPWRAFYATGADPDVDGNHIVDGDLQTQYLNWVAIERKIAEEIRSHLVQPNVMLGLYPTAAASRVPSDNATPTDLIADAIEADFLGRTIDSTHWDFSALEIYTWIGNDSGQDAADFANHTDSIVNHQALGVSVIPYFNAITANSFTDPATGLISEKLNATQIANTAALIRQAGGTAILWSGYSYGWNADWGYGENAIITALEHHLA